MSDELRLPLRRSLHLDTCLQCAKPLALLWTSTLETGFQCAKPFLDSWRIPNSGLSPPAADPRIWTPTFDALKPSPAHPQSWKPVSDMVSPSYPLPHPRIWEPVSDALSVPPLLGSYPNLETGFRFAKPSSPPLLASSLNLETGFRYAKPSSPSYLIPESRSRFPMP